MIFNVPGHIDMIRSGIKTQTRRVNRGIYQVGKDYAVQRKRGVKAESDIRIEMDWICEQTVMISKHDACMEGGYTPLMYEKEFRKAYPKWDGVKRWAFKFHVIEVKK
jgi:hypothetical protein